LYNIIIRTLHIWTTIIIVDTFDFVLRILREYFDEKKKNRRFDKNVQLNAFVALIIKVKFNFKLIMIDEIHMNTIGQKLSSYRLYSLSSTHIGYRSNN